MGDDATVAGLVTLTAVSSLGAGDGILGAGGIGIDKISGILITGVFSISLDTFTSSL